MADFSKINYLDLKLEAAHGRLPVLTGRREEAERLTRVVSKDLHNNCLVVGEAGSGKTALLRGWSAELLKQTAFQDLQVVELDSESFAGLQAPTGWSGKYQEALAGLPSCAIIIDDFGRLVFNKPLALQAMLRLLKPSLDNPLVRVILSCEPHQLRWTQEQDPSFGNYLETIALKPQTPAEYSLILRAAAERFRSTRPVAVTEEALQTIIALCQRFPKLGALPGAGIKILDESLGACVAAKQTTVTEEIVQKIVADKTGVPLTQLATNEMDLLKTLASRIEQRIIGQTPAVETITNIIQRAKLGLKNPNRPLGSFLVLGPSGVGKTETAKTLAELVYGKTQSFIRIDMSEFGEANTVPRLIGAPPGYIGYDAGGGLTNLIKAEPYSLVLLDEIEKAHSKIFDVFLQILDDGRVTSGQGETVDFTQTIIMATSNLAVDKIIAGHQRQAPGGIFSQDFIASQIMPELTKHFRAEFINRFDAIVMFKPLSHEDLLDIALLEIAKIEQRVSKHKIKFNIDPEVLSAKIRELGDPRFGARPVKRFVEQVCETLITKALLK
jgi:ATP-dependent Clp protease ATP-binding subunit ClpC